MASKMASMMAASTASKLPRPNRRVMTDSTCSDSSDHGASKMTLTLGSSRLPRPKRKVMTESTCSESSDQGVVPRMTLMRSPTLKKRVTSDSAFSDSSDHSVSDLKDANVRLRSKLDGQQSQLRQLHRDKQLEVRQLHEKSQTKLAIALKELRVKLHHDKAKEIMQIKEAQQRKMETELHKIVKQKDMEIYRLQGDMDRLQTEMQDLNNKGLSGGARGIFVAERTRLAREVHELRTAKRTAEDHLMRSQLAEKQSRAQLKKLKEEQEEALASVRAGYQGTIGTLETQLDQEKQKVVNLEECLRSSNDQVTELTEKLNVIASHDDLHSNQEPEDQDKGPPGGEQPNQEDVQEMLYSQASLPAEPNQSEQLDLDELRMRVTQLEEKNNQLLSDKQLLEEKLQEAEGHLDPMKEKVRNYLEKNMILSAKNVNIDEQLHQLKEDYHSLHHQLMDYENKEERIIKQVKSGNLEEGAVIDATELNRLKECISEQDKTIEALKVACNEKDRRIEVLVQRQRNKRRQKRSQQKVVRFLLPAKAQSPSAAGVKETYFGYDDVDSVDSEMSSIGQSGASPSPDNTLDEDIAEELSKAQYEQSYQRLLREHLELEKAFALSQAQSSAAIDQSISSNLSSPTLNFPASDLETSFLSLSASSEKETALEEEREKLHQTVKKLQEKLNKYRGRCDQLQGALQEAEEQAEEMEFRLLEIQESKENGKSSEERDLECSEIDEQALLVASKYASLKDLNVSAIIEWLKKTKSSKGSYLDLDSKHAGLQAETLIQNIANKLEDQSGQLEATNQLLNDSYRKSQEFELKAKQLQQEKLDQLRNANSENTDLVFAHEQLSQQLEESRKAVNEFQAKISEFEKAEAVYKYTEEYSKKTEQRLTEEVVTLRRQLTSSNAGRNYEAEFIKEKLDLLKVTEQKLKDYESKEDQTDATSGQDDLEKELERLKVIEADYHRLQQEHADLSEQLSAQRSDDEHSLAESDKDTVTQLSSLKSKVVTLESKEQELLDRTKLLLAEINDLKSTITSQEKIEAQLKAINMSLQDEVKEAKDRIHRLLAGAESGTAELVEQSHDNSELERLREEVINLREQLEAANQRPASNDLEVKFGELEKENLTLKETIEVKDNEVTRLIANLEKSATDNENARKEIDTLKKENIRTEDQLITAKTNIAQLKLQLDDIASDSPRAEKIHDLQESEKKLKEKIQTMEGAIQVLKSTLTEAVSKEKRTDDELKSLLKSEITLRCQVDEYVEHATELEDKIRDLEGNNKSLENELKKAELEKVRLANKLEALHDLEGQVKDLTEVKDQTQQLEHVRTQLQEKIELLQTSLTEEGEKRKEQERHLAEKDETTKQLQEKIAELTSKEAELQQKLVSEKPNNEVEELKEERELLNTQVKELQQKLSKSEEKELQAKDALSLVGEEKERRIDQLTDKLTKMEDKEARLLETIHDLEEMEKQLHAQLRHRQEQEDQLQEYELQIATLHERERDLQGQIHQLSESESDLKDKLAKAEREKETEKTQKGAADKSEETRSYKDIQKIIELEAQVQEFTEHEAKLMEQMYQLKMENQEMQEHIEQLIDVDNLSQQNSPRADQSHDKSRSEVIEELRSKVKELEQLNADLKGRLLQTKLDSIETTKGSTSLNNEDIQEVREELKKVRVQLEDKVEETDELQTKLQKLRSENVRQESRQGELEEEVRRKTIKCEQLENKIELLTEAERKLMERVEQLEGTEQKLKKEVSKLKAGDGVGQDEKENELLKKKVSELEEQVQEIQGKRQALKVRLSHVEESEGEELQRLNQKIDLLSESEEKLLERVEQLEEVESVLRKQLATSEEEVHQLEDQVQENRTLSKAAEELASAIDRISELEQEIEELNSQAKAKAVDALAENMAAELVQETVTLESAPPSDKSEKDLTAEAERLQKKEKAYLDHIEELEQKLEEQEELSSKLREELTQAQHHLQEFEEEMIVLKKEDKSAEVSSARERVQELETLETTLRTEIKEHKDNISDLEAQIEKLAVDHQGDLKEAHSRIEELEDAEEQLQEQLGKAHQESKDLKEALNATKEEQATLIKKLEEALVNEKEAKEQLQQSKALIKDLENQLLKAKDDLKDLDNKLKESENSQVTVKEIVTKLESEDKTLKEDVNKLEEIKVVLQDKLQKSLENEKLLQEKLNTKEENVKGEIEQMSELSSNIIVLEAEKTVVLRKLEEVEDHNKQLQEKLEKTTENEQKVSELLEASLGIEATHKHLIKDLEEKLKTAESQSEVLHGKLNDSEQLLKGLNEKLLESVDRESELKQKLEKSDQTEKDLKQKLDISLITENSLNEKVKDMENKIQDYNKLVEDGFDNEHAKERLGELEENNKKLRDRITDHEKSASVLQSKWLGSIELIEKLEKEKSSYEQKFEEEKEENGGLRKRLLDLEQAEFDLKTKVKDAEKQNLTLVTTMESLKEFNKYEEQDIESVVNKAQVEGFSASKPDGSMGISSLHELDIMTKQNMMSRIQELEYMEKFHLAKISRLQENLNNFRVAVETVTVNLEADTDVPVLDTRPQTKDSEYEAKVQELVRSEVFLRYKVFEMEKELTNARSELGDAKKGITSMESEFKDEMEEMEHEVNKLRKSEARLKNTLNYGGPAVPDGDPLAKIQHLEGLVFDLESSERKLKRRIQELLDTEQDLRSRLEEKEGITTGAHGLVQEIQEKDRHYELMTELKLIEMTDRDLKDQLSQLEKEDRESLILKIADMERKERALTRKLEILEMKELTPEDSPALESPEAVMKQKLRQLERIEKHLKTQVVELERDREDLHELARKDKNTIHDLNVQLRELQLSENNLKEQMNRYEVNENHLQMKLDDLTEKLHDLEDKLRKQQITERHLRAQLHKYQFSESDLNIKFEAILEDAKLNEEKLRKKIGELEKDKRELTDKTDELGDKVSDLENVELTLKQKLRSNENNEASLQGHMKSLEMSETAAKLRVLELESLNEQLSDRTYKLEEEKAGLVYEMSELELNNQDAKRESNNLQHMVDTLKEKLSDSDAGYESLASRLQDSLANVADLTSKLEDYQHAEREWQEKFAELEKLNRKYKQQIEDLEAGLSAKDKSAGLEEESSFLNLRLAQVQKDLQNAEEDNIQLHDKLKMFETSMTNHQMATLPVSEVNDLRDKEAKLSQLEVDYEKLKITERKLKKTIEDMRSGSNPCGHDVEIKDLKDEINKFNNLTQEKDGLQRALNSTKKAHSLLKTNYEDVKIQLAQLRKKFKVGDEKTKQTSNKSIQAHLEQTVSLKDITPELKNALKNLGAKHPEVYQEFIRSFIPENPIKKSSQVMIATQMVVPRNSDFSDDHQGYLGAEPVLIGHYDFTDDKEEEYYIEEEGSVSISDAFSESDDESLDDSPVAGNSTGSVKAQRVQDFVDRLPSRKNEGGSEDLWRTVESPLQVATSDNSEETLWANIEKSQPGEYDDMTIGMAFNEESDNSESIHITKPEGRPSSSLSAGSTPPPLPGTIPPALRVHPQPSSQNTDSYYLPSDHHGDSADEASDLDEDPTSLRAPRAKSVDRDSDFSESHTTKSSKMGPLSGSMDSIADSGLGTLRQSNKDTVGHKLVQLEKMLRTKERELEIANVNMKELERRLETFEPQTRTKREIHIHKQFTVNQSMEAEMSLTKPADAKQLEELQTLRDEVSRLRNFIKAKEEDGVDTILLQKEKELKAKENEVDQISQELRKWQVECRDAQDDHQRAQTSLALLEDKVVTLQKIETQYVDLRNDHEQLEEEYTIIKKKHQIYDDAETERADLEDIVVKLRGQLKDLERIELEREDLEMKLHALETELKNMKTQESELLHENAQLKTEVESRKKETGAYRNMEKEYMRIRSRFEELERTKSKAETLVTPLRAKVIRLAQKCRIKDDLIERLLNEIRRHGDGDIDVVAEADRVQAQTASEEYNRPLSPLEINNPAFEEAYSSSDVLADPSSSASASMLLSSPPSSRTLDPDDLIASHSPALRSSKSGKKRLERPHSIELATLHQGTLSLEDLAAQSQLLAPPQYAPGGATLPRQKPGRSQAPPTDLFTAIKDYEPQLFSDSGHQRLELPLAEGQVVRILGPPDQSGYYEAEVNGKVGLVPGRYLAPLYPHPPSATRSRYYGDSNNNMKGAPEQILSLHEKLRTSHVPLRHAGTSPMGTSRGASITHPAFLGLKSPLGLTSIHQRSRARGMVPNGRASSYTSLTNGHGMHTNSNDHNGTDGAPEPPMRLEVQRVVGHSSLLLSWVPPFMDELGCSNGLPVKGYKLYINGRDRQLLSSPYMTKALVENLNLQRPIQFTLQTVGQHGRMSRPVDTVYDQGSRAAVTHDDSDISSVMSGSNQADEGERRVFLAVYDYNPTEHSPNSFPDNELAFHTGDIITTYGTLRSDGFYQAKVKGHRGLVPASFIQEVALVRSHSKRSGSVASSASQPRPSSQASHMSTH